MQLIFVLVEPQQPENVGAAARALKTMGFNHLRIVNSCAHTEPPARWLAVGASDILAAAEVYSDIALALRDCDLAVATTAKARAGWRYYPTPEELRTALRAADSAYAQSRVALVFGREDRGLSGEELRHCQALSRIPLATDYPSLNLAQAVMLYAYALGRVEPEGEARSSLMPGELAALRERLVELIALSKADSDGKMRRWLEERLPHLAERDGHFLHQLSAKLLGLLPKPKRR